MSIYEFKSLDLKRPAHSDVRCSLIPKMKPVPFCMSVFQCTPFESSKAQWGSTFYFKAPLRPLYQQ
jgi:hypothetical protein